MKFDSLYGPTLQSVTTAVLVYTAPATVDGSVQVKIIVQNVSASTAGKAWVMVTGNTDSQRVTPKVPLGVDEGMIVKDITLGPSETLYVQADTASIFTVKVDGMILP